MIYDFFSQLGSAGLLLWLLLIACPVMYCIWLYDKFKINTLRPSRRYFFYFSVAGTCVSVLLLIGFERDSKLRNPTDADGHILLRIKEAAEEHSYSQSADLIETWQENYDKANAGWLKPRDTVFLPWLFGLCGLSLAVFKPRILGLIQKRRKRNEELAAIEQQQESTALEQQLKRRKDGYDDLESAIQYFSDKAKRIDGLEIDEDEKELLLMKLREKKERAMEQFV